MANPEALAQLKELYNSGALTPEQKASVDQLSRAGAIDLGVGQTFEETRAQALQEKMAAQRKEVFAEQAADVGPVGSFFTSVGKGFANVGRGVGLVDPAAPEEQEGFAALKEQRPITTFTGEVLGEAAPFIPLGIGAAGGAAKIGGGTLARLGAAGAVGTTEGAILAEDSTTGGLLGGATAITLEALLPVLGSVASRAFRRIMGKAPKGSLLDKFGTPTAELKEALDMAGMSFEDLTADAQNFIKSQPPGSDPNQLARAALFAEEGVPITKGELIQDAPGGFEQIKTEQGLLESAGDVAAEPFRQYKLKQSEAIKKSLSSVGFDTTKDETGALIQDALLGRKSLLRTTKNELYEEAADRAKNVGHIPVFTDEMAASLPDQLTMERLSILDEAGSKKLNDWLIRFGVKEPTEEMLEKGFSPETLTIETYELFRQGLNEISQSSNAIRNATGPLKNALDSEGAELASILENSGLSKNILDPLIEARKTVRTLKTEFSPQSIVGQIIDVKKDGVTQVTNASQVYDKLVRKSVAKESVEGLMSSLSKSGEKGQQAIATLQASTIMDLIDSGFGTESRKISGVKIFNPIAFKKRLETIGKDKIKSIFGENREVLNKVLNIDRIATELIPPSGAQPKGSLSGMADIFNKLGLVSISAKMGAPGAIIAGAIKQVIDPIKTGNLVRQATRPAVETQQIISTLGEIYPNIGEALIIAGTTDNQE